MKNKYSFWSLCKVYDKIEVPIIQRDYAQGRETMEVVILREKFINGFLIEALLDGEAIELDFVYGSIVTETKGDFRQKTFIPLDGQQRLTTLFLLYYFVAVKEGRLAEIKGVLSRFTYETRPSAHDFCEKLLNSESVKEISNIKIDIQDSIWFNNEWENDPTISGMLNMLDTFANNRKLVNAPKGILDRLIDEHHELISFYFTDLEEFGLTENLYIRMNARGKMLTDFENFKSEFSKIIRYENRLHEQVKDKIEYAWVDNLWEYKEKDIYTIDAPFMAYLSFVTEMLYFSNAVYRSPKTYESNFLSFKVLKDIYSIEENLNFLIFAFDFIDDLKNNQEPLLWDGQSLHGILKDIVSNKRDTVQMFILFMSIKYAYANKPSENLYDFVRVVRNLISNTDDNSRREWPRLLHSLSNLISDENVYKVLLEFVDAEALIGFNVDQRKEEVFKAKLILAFDSAKERIFKIEDHTNLTGRITNLLKAPFTSNAEDFKQINLNTLEYTDLELEALSSIFESYKIMAVNDFNNIWGNFLTTSLYYQTPDSRLMYSGWKRHPAIILFAKELSRKSPEMKLSDFVVQEQKDFVLKLAKQYDDFSLIRNVKEQLYLYYIIGERIYNHSYANFFKNGNYNIGWLAKESGYKSHFTQGIKDCRYFPVTNPVFQFYNQQFRYNLGINRNNTLDVEIVGGNKKRDPFQLILEWASN
ncbi:DUF262 domain-containing protein [Sphingobacterium griseoflavum]|uniref:GmrSD restriction endonucleases N-terminal domain-containing protein n=1 Tax=Sphingobacterium griseoflavum TaxID=1474952 RepID=A0ABQ3I2X1_9SPHI|nr:DUF262 domain-containing protein [Sphingobacterium griseoflavum]GHE49548.1 hypothetical protein GCM10017764_35700 [Sphingobacterium griseoflavum]